MTGREIDTGCWTKLHFVKTTAAYCCVQILSSQRPLVRKSSTFALHADWTQPSWSFQPLMQWPFRWCGDV
jgi:hypothetical protein